MQIRYRWVSDEHLPYDKNLRVDPDDENSPLLSSVMCQKLSPYNAHVCNCHTYNDGRVK